jgi:hypothetical protein
VPGLGRFRRPGVHRPSEVEAQLERRPVPGAPVVDVVSSPFVIVDALFGAITSSGQALILPGIAFLFGVVIPGIRRRIGLEKLEGAT